MRVEDRERATCLREGTERSCRQGCGGRTEFGVEAHGGVWEGGWSLLFTGLWLFPTVPSSAELDSRSASGPWAQVGRELWTGS